MVVGLKTLAAALASAPLAGQALVLSPADAGQHRDGNVLFGTMTFPEDNLPLDITVAHQVRMISDTPGRVSTVIVDNRPPWMSQVSIQEDILTTMQKTGQADIVRCDYETYDKPSYLQKFFKTGNPANSTKTIEAAHDKSDISGQHMSSNTFGMFAFLERCLAADDTTSLCIFLDPDIVVYRDGQGMAELAKKAFDQNPGLIAMNPPTMCSWDAAKSTLNQGDGDPIGLKRVGLLSQRYLVLNRTRLVKALPLPVPHEEFDVNFEHLFHLGMTHHSYNAARRMTCGHAFAIHPFSSRWAHCRNKAENINIIKHSELMMEGSEDADAEKGAKAETHYGFNMTMVSGLRELFRRVEAGLLPVPEDPWSTTNGCEDMCPNKTRIRNGLAW